jgi:glycosyltransferase involved in cell wall biosynthesis
LNASPTVSVLIPAYNAERYVGETLESVLRQTHQSLEVIVVDDGSRDRTAEVVRGIRDPRIRLVQQENKGQSAAINKAVSLASGDFIQYLDSDDVLDPEKIRLQVARLVGAPGAVATSEWGRFYDEPANTEFKPEAVWKDMDPLEWLVESRQDGLDMMFPALWLVPTGLARQAGPWDERLRLSNDAEYFTRVLLLATKVLFCKGSRCHYRSGLVTNESSGQSASHRAARLLGIGLCEQYVRAREDSDRVRRGFALTWQHLAHGCYPYDPELAETALRRARALHPVRIRPSGGPAFKVVSRIVGWRLARRLQVASGRP